MIWLRLFLLTGDIKWLICSNSFIKNKNTTENFIRKDIIDGMILKRIFSEIDDRKTYCFV